MFKGQKDLRRFLDRKVEEYNRPDFIINDPISIPHQFSRKQDIEIASFFTAIFSWGNRTTIIRKSKELMQLMDQAPYQFILQHEEEDLKKLLDFRHRTFNATDLLYFIAFFKFHYTHFDSLEDAFLRPWEGKTSTMLEGTLSAFYHYFFSLSEDDLFGEHREKLAPRRDPFNDGTSSGRPVVSPVAPPRTRKHIATPEKNSSCKRLNMFLRWMVRKDNNGVDFGIWNRLSPSQLICPLDVHVARVAKKLGLLTRPQTDWLAAMELTDYLLILDKKDPTKYDFALFSLGALEKF
jgi:uncharacterized protein (TIGR02757 family)